MAELQTASAICGIVRTTWQTIELSRDIFRAPEDAQMLWGRTKSTYQLMQCLDAVIKLRRENAVDNTRPLSASIVLVIEGAAKNCQQVLQKLADKCIQLGAHQHITRGKTVKESVSFALSAKSIQKFETNLIFATQMVKFALELLNNADRITDRVDTSVRFDIIEALLRQLVADRGLILDNQEKDHTLPSKSSTTTRKRLDSGVGLEEDARSTAPNIEKTLSTSIGEEGQLMSENLLKFAEQINVSFGDFHPHVPKEYGNNANPTPLRANDDDDVNELHTLESCRTNFSLLGAIEERSPEKCEALLSRECEVNKRNEEGLTAFMCAAACEHGDACESCLRCMKMLVDHGADLDQTHEEKSALHLSVKHGNLQIAKWLVESSAEIEASSPRTPLFLAVKYNRPTFVDLLVSAGANVNVLDEHNWSLIHYAVNRNCKAALLELLQSAKSKGIDLDVNGRCEMTWTPLMHLAEVSDKEENVQLAGILIKHGAKVDATDGNGYTALWYAVQGRFSAARNRFVFELLRKGADDAIVKKKAPKKIAVFGAFKTWKLSTVSR
ncbi:uncharacterized protein N0V89_003347 [Didymosphaeria variabile]|uniref:Ankyrin n=1 Tax=Didymosphaeria variabile TaxID=1932322 RepID=A0A9W9CFG3_9PLEO|nr:uncharacterized protein N0V89_003347 [Didymosphaeria variabile]KAJ4358763.1 hypothetical protein N0V89_003347 [Didymosphaeria variabile]